MNIEDLVYKTGPDGKPKKPKKTAKSAAGVRTAGRAASDFAAAVKAELDAKQSAVDKLNGLSSSDRLGARLNDAKGQPKNTAAGTLYVDKDVPLEPAGITQEHVNQFFSGQALLSDFAPLSSGTLHVPLDLPLEQPLEQSSDDIGIRSKSARDSSQAEKGVSTAGTAAYGVTRRKSFNELDYLYRAAKLNNKAEKKKAAEHSFWGSNIAPALAELPSKSKHKKKGSYNGPEVAIKPSSARPRVRSELTSQEKELRDEALYASLVRMYELQARLEAEAAQKASVLGRMGRLFTFGGKSDKKTSADSAAPAGSISPVEGKKRKDKTGSGSGNDKAFVPVKDLEAEKVRTFASMFSLPSLFRRKE